MAVSRITLDLQKTFSQVSLQMKRGDNTNEVLAIITDNGQPYDLDKVDMAMYRALKPDKTYVYNNCEIHGNEITVPVSSQTINALGLVLCELNLYSKSRGRITTARFSIVVEEAVYGDNIPESTNEFSALTKALIEVEDVKDSVEEIYRKLEEYRKAGDFNGTTFFPHMEQISNTKVKIYWTNNRELDNPEAVELEGVKGNTGDMASITITRTPQGIMVSGVGGNGESSALLENNVIVDMHTGKAIHFWFGTKSEYDALTSTEEDWIYILTDNDTYVEDIVKQQLSTNKTYNTSFSHVTLNCQDNGSTHPIYSNAVLTKDGVEWFPPQRIYRVKLRFVTMNGVCYVQPIFVAAVFIPDSGTHVYKVVVNEVDITSDFPSSQIDKIKKMLGSFSGNAIISLDKIINMDNDSENSYIKIKKTDSEFKIILNINASSSGQIMLGEGYRYYPIIP